MYERFTDRARKVVLLAQDEARRLNHQAIDTEHLLLGLIHEGEGLAATTLGRLGVSLEVARRQVEEITGRGREAPAGNITLAERAEQVLNLSLAEAEQLGHEHIGTEHLLLGLVRESGGVGAQVLAQLGADPDLVRQQVITALQTADAVGRFLPDNALHRFGNVLTGQPGPVTSQFRRSVEIERVMQVLARRSRNNPILVGEPGVGKTALVEGLAARLVDQPVPSSLRDRRILAIDPARFLAGVLSRAQLDARIEELLAAIQHVQVILFFDDLHHLARTTALGADIGYVLAPFIAADHRVIGATTPGRFRQYVEQDPLLERDCQPVEVTEPSMTGAVEIIARGVRDRLEAHHRMAITDAALVAAVTLARRYRPDRVLPGSAIDILDDAAALVAVRRTGSAPDLAQFDQRLAQVRRDKEAAIDAHDYERAALLRDAEKQILGQRAQREREWTAANLAATSQLDDVAVAEVLGVDPATAVTPQAVAYRTAPGGVQLPVGTARRPSSSARAVSPTPGCRTCRRSRATCRTCGGC
jgi:ATP-dependent Clp protease ATP-binding subunit ClpC